jgi:hypothetical protein
MGIALPIALVALAIASVSLWRRPQRPPLLLVAAVEMLFLAVGFLLGFLLAGVETSYLRGHVAAIVAQADEALRAGETAELSAAFADGAAALREGQQGISVSTKVLRRLEMPDGE